MKKPAFIRMIQDIIKGEDVRGFVIGVQFKDGTYFTGITRDEEKDEDLSHVEILGLAEAIKQDAIINMIEFERMVDAHQDELGQAFAAASKEDEYKQVTIDDVL